MDAARWARIKALFQETFERDPHERAGMLDAACRGDVALRQAVESLIAAHAACGDFMHTSPFTGPAFMESTAPVDEEPAPSRIGPYRIERELGRGGMGTVYLAERDEPGLRKTVAIKVVRRGMDTEIVLRRFRRERQILAALEHAGIARFYDGGTTEDGRPYFVMEYVAGESVLAYCDGRRLSTAERVSLFRRVCNAVQFAHQALIVHRDLKPSNILVTAEGEPKLLDFGIAKLVSPQIGAEEGEEATATMLRIMTPEYASPEQVRGHPVTTASDVYSLGVILYELLSGRRPYLIKTRHAAEIERAVSTQDVPAPSAVVEEDRLRRALRGDLDTIVLTAMQKDPGRRYATAAELADDLGRYLDGHPVHARPDRWSYRATKFVRRHRLTVVAATAAIVSLLAGLGVALWETRVAHQQRAQAQAQRALAQRRFDEARRLIQTVISDIQPKLAAVPGTTPLRKTLIDSTLSYLEALARDAGADPALLRELAGSYVQLARVQSDSTLGNLGDVTGSRETLARAEAIVQRLLQVDPYGPESLRTEIAVHTQLSRHQLLVGSPQGAVAEAQRALELADRLLAQRPGDPDRRADRADALLLLGAAVQVTDRPRAEETLARSREMYESLLVERPGDPRLLQSLARVHKNVAGIHMEKGETRTSLDLMERARGIDDALLAAHPDDPVAQMDLAIDLSQLGTGYDLLGDFPRAISSMRASLAMRDAIVARNPGDARARNRLAYALAYLADIHQRAGDTAAAFTEFERAERLYGEARAAGDQSQQTIWMLASTEVGLAQIERDRGRRAAACQHYRQAVSLYAEQEARVPLFDKQKEPAEEARNEASRCGR